MSINIYLSQISFSFLLSLYTFLYQTHPSFPYFSFSNSPLFLTLFSKINNHHSSCHWKIKIQIPRMT
ncbi:hypothetical protein Lalb_Chr21g0316201 [Lupinus albus]|uniref:Uncharacterized protein n=1 Tax=Lupinus albus TaxID=3870 RepID=A0A6A4NDP4_LUPAL|nr:hypothetical protein Lalb_Chr21g0316201 [Lupinus albus]